MEEIWRAESRRIFATLVRLLGDFDLAEEALHDAFAAALEQWPVEGVPARPGPWLVSAGRFQALDALRRRARFDASLAELAARLDARHSDPADGAEGLADDQLRLIFTCCHPALSVEAQVALTLREVCGLTTEAIARAYLTTPATLAQRIVRAKQRLRELRVACTLPATRELPARLDAVLQVLYLVFNEGYAASAGAELVRADLSDEAIRLGRLLAGLLPEPEVQGLLGLMLLLDARRAARTTDEGDLVLLEDQDRSRWDRDRIAEGRALVESALRSGRFGAYTLQSAIAAVHAEAADAAATDWPQIVALYELLLRVAPSPVVELNLAVALAMRDGPAPGLARIDALQARGELAGYAPLQTARADLCRRLGRTAEARTAYGAALALTRQEPERRFLQRRLRELDA